MPEGFEINKCDEPEPDAAPQLDHDSAPVKAAAKRGRPRNGERRDVQPKGPRATHMRRAPEHATSCLVCVCACFSVCVCVCVFV